MKFFLPLHVLILSALFACNGKKDEPAKDDTVPAKPQDESNNGRPPWVVANHTNPDSEPLATEDSFYVTETSDNEIKFMTYNVENLFDAEHDEGKEDYEYLPLNHPLKKEKCPLVTNEYYREKCLTTDWTPAKLQQKLKNIKFAIDAQGSLPDVLALQEVENENVIEMLAKELGYKHFFVTDSADTRGIDNAVLFNETRLRLVAQREIDLSDNADIGKGTRNVLVLRFSVNSPSFRGQQIALYVNHWPSQSNPAKERLAVAKAIQQDIKENLLRADPMTKILITGDFNTVETDDPHPFYHTFLNRNLSSMVDAQDYALTQPATKFLASKLPPGSYFFNGTPTWNKLDRFFLSQNLVDGLGLNFIPGSFRIVANSRLTETRTITGNSYSKGLVLRGVPKGFSHGEENQQKMGYSDHFPVVIKLGPAQVSQGR